MFHLNCRRPVKLLIAKDLLDYVFPAGSDGKESACNAGDLGSMPGSEGNPGEGNGNPLQCSCLESSMDRGNHQATYSSCDCKKLDTTDRLTVSFPSYVPMYIQIHKVGELWRILQTLSWLSWLIGFVFGILTHGSQRGTSYLNRMQFPFQLLLLCLKHRPSVEPRSWACRSPSPAGY